MNEIWASVSSYEEHHCKACGNEIDAPTVTGLLCSDCWLNDQRAA